MEPVVLSQTLKLSCPVQTWWYQKAHFCSPWGEEGVKQMILRVRTFQHPHQKNSHRPPLSRMLDTFPQVNTTKKLKEIAKELGVAHILEGSIQRANGRVRVVGQLIDAERMSIYGPKHMIRKSLIFSSYNQMLL